MISELRRSLYGKKVLVTGHTGFKGSWLSLWLNRLGAEVYGYSLSPNRGEMFDICNIADEVDHCIGDIRDVQNLNARVSAIKPDIVLHLAAQAIVRESYNNPMETLSSNIIGTANVLEAVRSLDRDCAVVVVSSDKCYENREWVWGYRENDPMGGKDPYSMSKGATELVVSSWRSSFFGHESGVHLASARAGNVIGGGDWAKDRIIPDCIRAFSENRDVVLRNPKATRPWQHVLEPLSGYLLLASKLLSENADDYCCGWNFGPAAEDVRPVEYIVDLIAKNWGAGCRWSMSEGPHPAEASMLSLNCDQAINKLNWRPTWNLDQLIIHTVDWFKEWHEDQENLKTFTLKQIEQFEADAFAKAAHTHRASS